MREYMELPGNPSSNEPSRIALKENDGTRIPVLNLIIHDENFPLDSGKLLQNFASLLNGNPPLHHLDSHGHKIFYQPLPGGVALHSQKPEGGVSDVGFLLKIPGHNEYGAKLGAEALEKVNPAFMQILCGAIKVGGSQVMPDFAPAHGPRPGPN